MASTSIEWTDHSVNPIRFGLGHYCQKISPGCANCYASTMQRRFGTPAFGGSGQPAPQVLTNGKTNGGMAWFDETKLQEVLRRRKPTKYFWCDMTDMFGSWVPDEWIDRCFATMALTPHHTHQVLTKRADRMHDYLRVVQDDDKDLQRFANVAAELADSPCAPGIFDDIEWPFRNVWLGVSVEDQTRADERIPLLLQTPAAVRFLSCEPLLGQVDLRRVGKTLRGDDIDSVLGWRTTYQYKARNDGECSIGVSSSSHDYSVHPARPWPKIDWVIVGGESGHGARPMHPQWARSLRDQCQAAGVPFFFKQWGEHVQLCQLPRTHPRYHEAGTAIVRVGKKAAGRLLDDREWSEFPEVSRC